MLKEDIREAVRASRGLAHRWALGPARAVMAGRGGGCLVAMRVLTFRETHSMSRYQNWRR
jgi:hypothetical protein